MTLLSIVVQSADSCDSEEISRRAGARSTASRRFAPYTVQPPTMKTPCPFDPSCTIAFASPSKEVLKEHRRKAHAALEEAVCHWRQQGARTCNTVIKDFDGLMRHITQCHLKEKACECRFCRKPLSRSDSRSRHELRCGSRRAVMVCSLCF